MLIKERGRYRTLDVIKMYDGVLPKNTTINVIKVDKESKMVLLDTFFIWKDWNLPVIKM
jgi:hypothetical protein